MKYLTKIFILSICLSGCSSPEQSELEKLHAQNAVGEFIYRKSDETLYPARRLKAREIQAYPWDAWDVGEFPKITKEFFRCKGSFLNPPLLKKDRHLFDCGGAHKHSLPLREEKEYVPLILIDLLNYLQESTCKQVVITCGHRCIEHNLYADSSIPNQSSKHTLAAEVDFYLKGLETEPERVVTLLIDYFKRYSPYKGDPAYEKFQRYDLIKKDLSTAPWYNKAIFIKLFQPHEGRDFDNQHKNPYIAIQVRHDPHTNESVTYSWEKAFKGYRRY